MLLKTRPLPLLVAAFTIVGCGGSVRSKSTHHDAGTEGAPPDAATDAPPDTYVPPPDAAPDVASDSGPAPGLGAACDGKGGNPSSCSSGLTCYNPTGQSSPQAGRWPHGYCTVSCSKNSDCSQFGGVCAGAYAGNGRCLAACTKPTDCRQGYACRNVSFQGTQMACSPTGFIATRSAGVACFQHTDPTGPNYAPLLDSSSFGNEQRIDTSAISSDEIAFAMNSANQVVAGANVVQPPYYQNANPSMYATGTSLPLSFATSKGPQYSSASYYSDPYIVAGSDGTFYYSTLGLNNSATMAWAIVGHSTDGGQTWQSVKVDPDADCAGSLGAGNPCLDHPWLAVGPDILNTSQDAVYAAYLATRSNTSAPTVLIRSVDGGQTWGIPGSPNTSLAVFGGSNSFLYTNLITPTVDSTGVVHMVVASIAADPHGSTQNAIMYARSEDGGKTATSPVQISKVGWPVPFEQPVITTDNGSIYVAYVTGQSDSTNTGGDWDIVLAISTDNAQTWNYQKVNDEPGDCATNFHPAIAVDHTTHKVYVAWYDGRYAPYEGYIALTVCTPQTSGDAQCTPNVALNSKPFYITTDRVDFSAFIGDYFTLHVKPGGEVWAGFGDTSVGGISHAFLAVGTP